MTPEEAVQAIASLNPSSSIEEIMRLDGALHLLHEDMTVRDRLWVMLDNQKLDIRIFDPISKATAFTVKKHQEMSMEMRLEWMRHHGWGEIYFYTAWALYRTGAAISVQRRCHDSLMQHMPGDKRSIWTVSLAEGELDGSCPYTHHTLPKLELGEDNLVHAFDQFDGAIVFTPNADSVDDPWIS